MGFLLDTHVFLWWVESPEIISSKTFSIIASSNNNIYLSSISLLEIAIKQGLGKLTPTISFDKYVEICNFTPLPITMRQDYAVKELPLYHKDPFDRALIAEAKTEGLTLITQDKVIAKYELPIIEA